MRRPRGWTLADALVAMAVASVVLIVVAQVMSSTSRLTRVQAQRSLQQTRLQAAAAQLERALLGVPSGAVAYESVSGGAVLAVHGQQTGNVVNVPRFEPFWRCFVWDVSTARLYFVNHPPPGGGPGPSTSRPQPMTGPEMDALLNVVLTSAASPPGRLVASRVTDFRYVLQPGPLFRVEIEVDVPEYDTQEERDANRMRAVKVIHPRL